ncbi:hypothetical protein OIU84_028796 [Salix udensis]|uniref:Uncharacterized protein n=1 Tax=Salix udensis TaxID=889485 RepID=A0AAD6KFD2_9ROSI|nr:hypothetical protein OIU84_028796 [Salix udensis]
MEVLFSLASKILTCGTVMPQGLAMIGFQNGLRVSCEMIMRVEEITRTGADPSYVLKEVVTLKVLRSGGFATHNRRTVIVQTHMENALDSGIAEKKDEIFQFQAIETKVQKSSDPILSSPFLKTLCLMGHFLSKNHKKKVDQTASRDPMAG